MLYWEIVPKYSADNKLLPEMILVCNALRNDLISPNEFIRGSMLRFLCKLKEPELLEPLIPSIKSSLDHRHSYVRRNAALAIYSIHKGFGDQFLPDAAELMEKFISQESDVSSRRNAFLMLFNEAETIAIDFLADHIDDIKKYGDGFALLVLELTRKVNVDFLKGHFKVAFRLAEETQHKKVGLSDAYSCCFVVSRRPCLMRLHGL